jgi:hypothetical protein
VGRWGDCDRLIAETLARAGRLDVLVNNAGMSPLYPSLDAVSEELFDRRWHRRRVHCTSSDAPHQENPVTVEWPGLRRRDYALPSAPLTVTVTSCV